MEFSKFDQLIYITQEADLDDGVIAAKVKELFPDFGEDNFNDKYLTPVNLEMYAYNRGLGLPIVEVAHSIRISATLLQDIYLGKRLSLEKLIDFAQAETFSQPETKARHLKDLERRDGQGATLAFLEKAYSKQYGDRKQIDVNTGFEEEDTQGWHVEITRVENKSKDSDDHEKISKLKGEDDGEGEIKS